MKFLFPILVAVVFGFLFCASSNALAAPYIYNSFDYPAAISIMPNGINNAGKIVGSYYDGSNWSAFLTTPTTINVPADYPTILQQWMLQEMRANVLLMLLLKQK